MEDNQRKAMYDGWKNSKITLIPVVERTKEYCLIEVEYNGEKHTCKAYQETMFGSTNTYNYAFNRVLTILKGIDKNIEMPYDVKMESYFQEEELPNENIEKKNTLVINLFGAPGSGKSTLAAIIFGKLKKLGVDIELVSEYAKELVWEERNETMKDELYIFAKQQHRFHRLNGKVSVIITDRPIALSKFYNHKYGRKSAAFNTLVDEVVDEYENYNIFLKRGSFDYNPEGRVQTDEESQEFELEMLDLFKDEINVVTSSEENAFNFVKNKIGI